MMMMRPLLLLIFLLCFLQPSYCHSSSSSSHSSSDKNEESMNAGLHRISRLLAAHKNSGIAHHRREITAVQYAKKLQERFLRQRKQMNPNAKKSTILISVFVNVTKESSRKTLHANIRKLAKFNIDFAVVVYDGSVKHIHMACFDKEKFSNAIIHCRKSSITYAEKYQSFPKPILFADLLPYLPYYKKVLLLDEDISLQDFVLPEFLAIWDCAFHPKLPPMIVQGLILEETDEYDFIHWQRWKSEDDKQLSNVIASETRFIEQQIPGFDSFFLYWFIEYVISNLYSDSLKYQSGWGIETTWCLAAEHFVHEVYNIPTSTHYASCALITGTAPFHHLKATSMVAKTLNSSEYFEKSLQYANLWSKAFPTWTTQKDQMVDPTWTNSGFQRIYSLNQSCPLTFGPVPQKFVVKNKV